MFENIINPHGKKIEKAEGDVAEYEFKDGVLRRVDPLLRLDSPKPTDATASPANRASNFPGSASIVDRPANQDAPRPMSPYSFAEPDVTGAGASPSEIFLEPDQDEVIDPKNFQAPAPAQRPEGPAAVRFGNGYVLKSEL